MGFKKVIKGFKILVFFTTCLIVLGSIGQSPIRSKAEEGDLGVESTQLLVNPDCGFYKAFSGQLTPNSLAEPISESSIATYAGEYGLLHFRIGLEHFSANAGGKNVNIDDIALQSLKTSLSYLRKYKMSAIIRFSYNVNGEEDANGDYLENEPPLELIEKHIKALGGAISEYCDVIIGVESGMLGPWGEQHSTAMGDSGEQNSLNYHKVVQTWLDSTPQNIGVTVRRPLYFTYWINNEYDLSLSINDLADFDCSNYFNANRVGVYNDGYLGSSTDWGTFKNREVEVAFIGKQAENTLYGGEVIVDDKTHGIGDYNCVSYLEQEAFITHTSYLNIDWNYDDVISVWQNNTYKGTDENYNGKTSEFTFVNNRLGYRILLTEMQTQSYVKAGESYNFNFTFKNLGFANMLRAPVAYLIFENEKATEKLQVELDLTNVKSKESKSFSLNVIVPNNLKRGEYNLYLDFVTAYGRKIKLANLSEFYNNDADAFYLGKIAVDGEVERESFLVTFDSNYGTVVSGKTSQTVNKGQSAVAPEVEREGYEFVGWDVDFSCITQDLSVTAIWRKKEVLQSDSSLPTQNGCALSLSGNFACCIMAFLGAILIRKKTPR